jgi:hypothetical protein
MRALLLLPALLLCSCEVQPSCSALDPAEAWLAVGAGYDAFAPLVDGDVMEVERGSQGGMHVMVAGQAGALHPGSASYEDGLRAGDLPVVEMGLDDPDGGVLNTEHRQPRVLQRLGDRYELEGRTLQFRHFAELPDNWTELDYAEVEADMELQEYRLWLRLTDSCGTVVEDERTVRLDFPERDPVG